MGAEGTLEEVTITNDSGDRAGAVPGSDPGVSPRPPREGERVLGEPISPELALVSPELAAEARRLLPERPWERFLPPPRVAVASPPLRLAAAPAPAPPAPVVVSLARRRPLPPPVPPVATPPRRNALRAVKLALGMAALVGVANLGAWESGDERLLPLEPSGPRAASRAPAAAQARLYPRAAYVITPRGGFRTGVQARAIGVFELPVRCGLEPLVVQRIPIGEDGSFRFSGVPRGSLRVTVTVSGRVVDRETVRGVARAHGPGCPPRAVRYVARVS